MNIPPTRAHSHTRGPTPSRADSRQNSSPPNSRSGLPGGLECQICFDVKSREEFPSRRMTKKCKHDPTDCCNDCLNRAISTASEGNMWDDIRCPICNEQLQFQDMAELAPRDVFERYKFSIRSFCGLVADSPADTIHFSFVEQLSVTCPTSVGVLAGTVHMGKNIPKAQPLSLCVALVEFWLAPIIMCLGIMTRRARNTIVE